MSERIKLKMKCPVCGDEVEGTRKDTCCIKCRAKLRVESEKRVMARMKIIKQKEKEIREKQNPRRCSICNVIMSNNHHNARFCPGCQTAVQKVKTRNYAREKQNSWINLSEEEKLRRMEIVSQKLLNGEIK